MPADYAVLQLYTDRAGENSQSALIGHLTAMMKREGLSPCGREEAEQTVAFAPVPRGGPYTTTARSASVSPRWTPWGAASAGDCAAAGRAFCSQTVSC